MASTSFSHLPWNLLPLTQMAQTDAPVSSSGWPDEDAASYSPLLHGGPLGPTSLEHFNTQRLPQCELERLRYESSLPFTQHIRSCANSALRFLSTFQNPLFPLPPGMTYTFPSPPRRYYGCAHLPCPGSNSHETVFSFLVSRNLHPTSLRPCCPTSVESLLSGRPAVPLPRSYVSSAASAHLQLLTAYCLLSRL